MATTGPPGPLPDANVFFGDPVVPVAVVTIVLSTLFVGMRFWSRSVILHVTGLEDWLLLSGWICAVATSATNIVQLQYGLGRYFASLSLAGVADYFKHALSINVLYALSLTFVKLSILCLYLRALNYERVRLMAKALLVIVAITHMWIIASILTACVPLDAFWDFSKRPTAYCHSYNVYWSHAGINIVTDFLIFTLPLSVMHKLRVPRREKIALYFVFLLAFSVCAISLIRTLQFIHGMTYADRDTVIIACWTMLEVNIAVVCACLVTIKPLLGRIFPRLFSSGQSSDVPGVDTIGQARRQRHNPLGSDALVATGEGFRGSGSATECVGMADLKAQKSCGSTNADIKTPGVDEDH